MPAVPTFLPSSCAGLADRVLAERDDRRQRRLHERADRDELGALGARQQQLGLVGDREVGPARRPAASAAPTGPTACAACTSSAACLNSPVADRGVDAGVVGVGEVVEDEVDALGAAASPVGSFALAAGGEAEREQRGEHGGRRGGGSVTGRFLSVGGPTAAGGARRAPAAPNSATEKAARISTAANARAVSNCGSALQHEVAEPVLGARPLGEDRGDRRRTRR